MLWRGGRAGLRQPPAKRLVRQKAGSRVRIPASPPFKIIREVLFKFGRIDLKKRQFRVYSGSPELIGVGFKSRPLPHKFE